jgi:hypothetical protein
MTPYVCILIAKRKGETSTVSFTYVII